MTFTFIRGVDPSLTWGDEFVPRQDQRACAHMGCLLGEKLENLAFLKLELCNLVNTFRLKFRADVEWKNKTKQNKTKKKKKKKKNLK